MSTKHDNDVWPLPWKRQDPFRRAVLRGLAVILPPLLTIVIFIWVWNAVQDYVLVPVETGARHIIAWAIADIHDQKPESSTDHGFEYKQLEEGGQWVPDFVVQEVRNQQGTEPIPTTGKGIYYRYVDVRYLGPEVVIPVFLCVFILVLYLLGKFLAIRVGGLLWNFIEQIIHRLPIVRNVYSSVKQVTDFVFSEQDVEYTRVVAVEYPRKGVWSIGFVTGESMLDIQSAANEPVLSVLMPTSPMPVTGFTITVRKSDTIDLDITIDQAIQFIVSCGVVVPPQQLQNDLNSRSQTIEPGSNGSDQDEVRSKFIAAQSIPDELDN